MFSFFRPKSHHPDWKPVLKAQNGVFAGVQDCEWDGVGALPETFESIVQGFDVEYKNFKCKDFLFPDQANAGSRTPEIVEMLRGWHVAGDDPSLAVMMAVACEQFGVSAPVLVNIVMVAAVLGEVRADNAYHNNLHFKKVALQSIRMISVHNSLYDGTDRALSEEDVAILLAGACVHDLGHDGQSNMIEGVYNVGYLERRSYIYAAPFLRAAGAGDEFLSVLKICLLTTDVAPLGESTNAVNQMKTAYRFHYMNKQTQYLRLNLSVDLAVLEDDARVTLLACLLHEADVSTSAGLDYGLTQFETCQFRDEIGKYDAEPQHIVDFLENVCQRQFLSEAGQALFLANMAQIYALAVRDVEAGNVAFPEPLQTDFILNEGGDVENKVAH